MSRHRFVRNIDLNDELDDGDEEVGMSAEETAQMNRAVSVARNLLKDVTPPISDNEIADSVWHYWFDGEKAAAWLRQDREKKGEAPPSYLEPTPLQQPRHRPKILVPPSQPTQAQEDIQPPLTALQRLTLSRRQGSPASPAPSSSVGEKPMSKLALLAQKRREAAAAATTTSETIQSGIVSPQTSRQPSASGTQPSSGTQSPSQLEKKPLSKLAQKMAAARAAREEAAAAAKSSKLEKNSVGDQMEGDEPLPSLSSPADPMLSLFSPPATSPKPKLKPTHPSPFFSIITSTSSQGGAPGPAKDHLPPEPTSANLHAPLITDVDVLVKQFEQAFAESPDEIVLRKRQGRAGTADMVTAVKKQATGTGIKPKVK